MKPLTVRQLIAILSKHDPNRVVVLATDMEGNGYNLLKDPTIEPLAYRETDEYPYIEIGVEKPEPGYADEVLEGGKPALVIYP